MFTCYKQIGNYFFYYCIIFRINVPGNYSLCNGNCYRKHEYHYGTVRKFVALDEWRDTSGLLFLYNSKKWTFPSRSTSETIAIIYYKK
ncbi:hypothetical protein ACH3XW_9415 [Acanthocheilonema viteae]